MIPQEFIDELKEKIRDDADMLPTRWIFNIIDNLVEKYNSQVARNKGGVCPRPDKEPDGLQLEEGTSGSDDVCEFCGKTKVDCFYEGCKQFKPKYDYPEENIYLPPEERKPKEQVCEHPMDIVAEKLKQEARRYAKEKDDEIYKTLTEQEA